MAYVTHKYISEIYPSTACPANLRSEKEGLGVKPALPPSDMQRHIPVKKLLASRSTVHNIRPGSCLLRGEPQLGSFRASLIGSLQSRKSGRVDENTNLGSSNITVLRPVIGFFLRALPEVSL